MTRRIGILSGMGLAAAAAAIASVGVTMEPPPVKRVTSKPRFLPYGFDVSRQERRAADRSKKKHLLKGVRP